MNGLKITYGIAHAAGWDAGNLTMRKGGRSEWNSEDLNEASRVMNELLDGGTNVKRRNRT